MRWTLVVAGLGLLYLLLATEAVRRLGPREGVLVSALVPLLVLGLLFAVVWVRGARHRRRLLEQEFRED